MQENSSSANNSEAPAVGRHRAPTKPVRPGRRALIATALVALAGLGLAGLSATATGSGSQVARPAAAAADEEARTENARRADRSHRETPAPVTPSASPSVTSTAPTPPAPDKAAMPAKPSPPAKPDWVSPMPGAEITSCFGQRWGTLHAGIDLAEPENTPIHAAGAGTVVAAGWAYTGYGISVVIDHGNGYLTHYAHQNKTNVKIGQKVDAGDLIGWEGATGDATGPHLHFEVHKGLWNQINPAPWLRSRGVDLGC